MLFALVLCAAVPSPGIYFPQIAPVMPRAALDLGPVIVEHPTRAQLLTEADRLGADGFVYESKSIENFYDKSGAGEVVIRSVVTTLASAIAHGASHSDSSGPTYTPPTEMTSLNKIVGFYRAFRLRASHKPLVLSPALPGATVDAQLAEVHASYASGVISLSEYERLRSALLAQITHA